MSTLTRFSELNPETPQSRRRWMAVAALGLSLFLSSLDGTIVALALPPIASRFQLSDSLAASVTLAYAIPLTLLVLPSGALVNRFRALPTFLISVLGFGIGSAACGLATNLLVLLMGRVIQGSFAALIGTQGFALAGAVVSPKERGRAMGLVGTIAPLGGIAGPGIGGMLLASFGWSSIFFVNVPVCLLVSALGVLSLRGVRLRSQVSSSISNNTYRQMIGLLRRPQFLLGLLAFFFSVSASVALYYLLPFDLSGVQHISPAISGAVLLCVPLGMVVMGMTGGYLTDRYHPRLFILAGSGLLFVGVLLLSPVVLSRTSELDLAWRLLLIGGGIGLFSSPNSTVIIGFGGREAMGATSALTNLAARLGSVVGPLALGLSWALQTSFSAQIVAGILFVLGFALMTFLSALLSTKQSGKMTEETPQSQPK